MTTWFTADTHFGHANIIKYSKRPFSDVNEMDAILINNWNKVVQPEDYVYHLGDFSFRDTEYYFNRLNGIIILVEGNHDKITYRNKELFYKYYQGLLEINISGQEIVLCHYAMKVWNKSHWGAWHLYGHSHGSLPDDPNSLSFDVGVDCHNYRPISFAEVGKIMTKKHFVPIDHHTGNKNK